MVCFLFLKFVFNLVPLDFLSSLVLGVFALLAWPVMNVMEKGLGSLREGLRKLGRKIRAMRAAD